MNRELITAVALLSITMGVVPARAQPGGGHGGVHAAPRVRAVGRYRQGHLAGPFYFHDTYGYGASRHGYPPPAAFLGGVRIKAALSDAQVYVDGAYAGIVEDVDGVFQRLTLAPGPHHIEVRMPGVSAAAFDVNVQVGRPLTIRP